VRCGWYVRDQRSTVTERRLIEAVAQAASDSAAWAGVTGPRAVRATIGYSTLPLPSRFGGGFRPYFSIL
jgi:hypothetical protein